MPIKSIFTRVNNHCTDSRKQSGNQLKSQQHTQPTTSTSALKKLVTHCKSKLLSIKNKKKKNNNKRIVEVCCQDNNNNDNNNNKPNVSSEAPVSIYTEQDYTASVLRLSEYLKIEDPMKHFYNFEFMCNSSVDGCKLYTCNSMGRPQDKFVMKTTKLDNKNLVIDTENELKIMRACNHKNVAKVHSVMGHESCIWIAMDHCEHGSLYKFMEKNKQAFDEHQIAYMCQQILSGIHHLHEHNSIMHLDIKSDNILVDKDFNMIISDFGSSVQLENSHSTFDKFRGTPYWIAPEMIPKERCYTNKVDIWSFGILLWELMHGKPPRYDKESLFELLLEIRYEEAPQLEKNHKWSLELVDFLYKALDKDPVTRWSAAQLLSHPFLKECEGEMNGKLFFSEHVL